MDLSDTELDAFDSNRAQILLDQAGEYGAAASSASDSEEEVMPLKHQGQIQEIEEEEEDDEEDEDDDDEEDNDGGWGSKKNYYGGDDVSDDDEGMAEEALRQQRKHLQELAMDDFVDEATMGEWQRAADKYDASHDAAPAADADANADLLALDDDEKLKHLAGLYPEFVPLLREFNALAPQLDVLRGDGPSAVVAAKLAALLAYLAAILSYFSLFVERLGTLQKFSMKESPVMEAILSTREVWRQASEIREVASEAADEIMADDEIEEVEDSFEAADAELDAAADAALPTDSESEDSESEAELAESSDDEIDISTKREIRRPKAADFGDYTDAAAPDAVDLEEKARRKKSLRFYTAKIDQAAQKSARAEKFDGDADLPYRERLFERQQRLVEEARKRGLGQDKANLGDALDGADLHSDDELLAQKINDDAEDYYESVKNAKAAKKEARHAAHVEAKRAAREGKLAELLETVDGAGKRALNFQILKNKGLTPHRRNENRNARVKKRKKYEQAKKKLRSVRQVYDANHGPYQGETTGIKKSVSRSIKFT